MNRMMIVITAAGLLAFAPGANLAIAEQNAEQPDATIDYTGGSVALGLGYSWGQGVLHFKGMDYPFTVNGISAGDVGASSINAAGNVYHLAKVADFPGTYTAITGGITVGGGASGTAMQNQNGVVMQVASTTQGLQLTIAPSGITVAFHGSPTPMAGSSTPSR